MKKQMKRKMELNLNEEQIVIKNRNALWHIKKCWRLYVLLLPAVVYLFIFNYIPIAGIQIAFKDYTASGGIWGSTWVGLKHFKYFFNSVQFSTLLINTVKLSVYSLLVGFPFPILLAILLNETKSIKLKKVVQSLTYAPYFISTVVLVSMVTMFLSSSTGIINQVIEFLGGNAVDFMGKAEYFRPIYVLSGIWQGTGWSSIIFIAALAGIDVQLHEAAQMDGANRLQKIWHIDLPGIIPTAVIVFIMSCGSIMSVGFEKAFLMQNSLNLSTSEIISTYVYKIGLKNAQYSFTTAIGLFNSVINLILLLFVNKISKKVSDVSLF
jgi:putative aldouronate transport system permease protein